MKKFLLRYKYVIVCACVAAAVLAVAFFAGGNGKTESKLNNKTPSSTAFQTEAAGITYAYSDKPEPAEVSSTLSATENTQNSAEQSGGAEEASKGSQGSSAQPGSKNQHNTQTETQNKIKPSEAKTPDSKDSGLYCSLCILCSTVFSNTDSIDKNILDILPTDGVILKLDRVEFTESESVFDVLQRACRDNNISLEAKWTPLYNSAYIEGISNLYELDCGENSGWKYSVNNIFPNYGCSGYQLKNGDSVKFLYTCNGGSDIGSETFVR